MWIQDFVTNTVFLTVCSSFGLAQLLKVISYSIKFKKFYWRGLIESGGLPSGHSALVASITTIIFFTQGFSAFFYFAFFISCIIMYDAMGVRRETGRQGALLNDLIKKHKIKGYKPMKEFVGHSPVEVFFGAVLGVLMAMLYYI